MDAVLIACVAREWERELPGMRVDRAYSPDPHRIDLALRGLGREARLTFALRPGEARCHPAADSPRNPAAPTGFCMFLRRHLSGARVLGVRAVEAERRLLMRLGSESEIGVREERELHFEAFGPRPNLILVDGAGRVMDAFRRVSAAGEGARPVLPGLAYAPPPASAKADPLALGPDGLAALCTVGGAADPVADLLVRRVRGMAPVWAREILARAGLRPDAAVRDLGRRTETLAQALGEFLALLSSGEAPAPCVAYAPDGAPVGAFPLAPRQFGPAARLVPYARVGDAVAAYHTERERSARLEQRRAALARNLERRRARLGQKLARQDQEWREAERDLALRHTGELILANVHAIAPGAREADVVDWQAAGEGGEAPPVRIALDPEMSASENAERLFARYRKARRRHDALAPEIARARRELEYIDAVADALRRADEPEVLEALAQEVEVAGALGPPPGLATRPPAGRGARPKGGAGAKRGAGKGGQQAAPPMPLRPLLYRTPGGFSVQVGRTGYENDRLSLRSAAPDDLWFHVAQGPGAHAVLRLADAGARRVPGDDDLAAAAMLAAYHSPARTGSHVEVDYCRAVRLRKPPGARPGLVLYDREGSLSVTPDPDAVEAMGQRAAGERGHD